MINYKKIVDMKIFTYHEMKLLLKNDDNTKRNISNFIKRGYIERIKKDLYVAINLETNGPITDKFMIASKIAADAVVSNISALEYYGYYNQVRNDCFVMTNTRFREFEYRGITYKRVKNYFNEGNIKKNDYLTVTDLEKSVIDLIKDLGKIVGLEEVNNILELIVSLDEDKLKKYLNKYNVQFYYQKAGYLLEQYKEDLNISDEFFDYINKKVKTRRYITNDNDFFVFNARWKLFVPLNRKVTYGEI